MRCHLAATLKQVFIAGLSLALVLSIGTQARAQGRQTGTLRGAVKDSTDAVLPGVTVTVTSDALQGSRTTVTDLNGNYEIIGLPPGQYTASFALQGFTSVDAPVTVPLGRMAEVNVSMQVGAVAEAIQVIAVVPTPLSWRESSKGWSPGRDPACILANAINPVSTLRRFWPASSSRVSAVSVPLMPPLMWPPTAIRVTAGM